MAEKKLKIIEYFDKLVSKLDLAVERSIYQNCYDEELISGLNKQRDAFINDIHQVQDFNLRVLSDKPIKADQELSDEDLFPKFCFFIEYFEKTNDSIIELDQLVAEEIGFRLIVTDKYLTDGQIECYNKFSNFNNMENGISGKDNSKYLVELLFEKVRKT
jgi:hypothetical protein